MRKRFDRVRYGPGWVEIIFGALLSIVLGVVLAAVLSRIPSPDFHSPLAPRTQSPVWQRLTTKSCSRGNMNRQAPDIFGSS